MLLLFAEDWEHRRGLIAELKRSKSEQTPVTVERHRGTPHRGIVLAVVGARMRGVVAHVTFKGDVLIPVHTIRNVLRNT